MELLEGNTPVQSQNSSDMPEILETEANWTMCRNVDVEVDQHNPHHRIFEFLFSGLLTSSLSLFGTFGNIKSATLLRNSGAGGQFVTETLTALAVWDTILLLSAAGYYSLGTIWEFVFGSMPNALLYSKLIFHPLCAASYAASALLVSALAAQRMFVVRCPLTPRRLSFRKCFTVLLGTRWPRYASSIFWPSIRSLHDGSRP